MGQDQLRTFRRFDISKVKSRQLNVAHSSVDRRSWGGREKDEKMKAPERTSGKGLNRTRRFSSCFLKSGVNWHSNSSSTP